MKILNSLLLITITIFLSACKDKIIEENVATFKNGNKQIVKIYEMIDGKKVLIGERQYYETGELKIEGKYNNDRRHGVWKSYYKNGNLWSKGTYIQGIENGEKVVNYEDGSLYYKGEVLNNKRVGKWEFIGIDGKKSFIDYDKKNTAKK